MPGTMQLQSFTCIISHPEQGIHDQSGGISGSNPPRPQGENDVPLSGIPIIPNKMLQKYGIPRTSKNRMVYVDRPLGCMVK